MKVRHLALFPPLLLVVAAAWWMLVPEHRAKQASKSAAPAILEVRSETAPRLRDRVQQALKPLENIDSRDLEKFTPSSSQSESLARLKEEVPGVTLALDEVTGAPVLIVARDRFLSPPVDGPHDARVVVAEFVNRFSGLFGHPAQLLTRSAKVVREDKTARSGLQTLVWEQELNGIPLYKTTFKANLTQKGELVSISSHLLARPVPNVIEPSLVPAEAISLAAASLQDRVTEEMVLPDGEVAGVERRQKFTAQGLTDVLAHLTYVPMDDAKVRLAWDVTLMSLARNEMHRVAVDAVDGSVLVRTNLTSAASDASFRVYADAATKVPFDSPTPMSPSHQTPSTTQPAEVARRLVTLTSVNGFASPAGWLPDGSNPMTTGNNVDAYADIYGTNSAGIPRPNGGPSRTFDFTLYLGAEPSTFRSASVTQLFYVNNWLHDVLYNYGFTETAGNFQTDNFGRGGYGNDRVRAEAQDGGGFNNANFSTPVDGQAPRMQMYLFNESSPSRDSALDSHIVVHEYVHGLSNRLVGGGVGISSTPARGMGEGWSDFYALALLAKPRQNVDHAIAAGGYSTYPNRGMEDNYYFGIRRYPYASSFAQNPLTLQDTSSAARLHDGVPLNKRNWQYSNVDPAQVHNVGEVWCNTLMEVRRLLIKKHGFSVGSSLMLQLVTDGMKLSPTNPTFLEARNAILQADLVLTGGANAFEMWSGFARRGFGLGATMPSRTSSLSATEAYDQPGDMQVTPINVFEAVNPTGQAALTTSKVYTLKNTKSTPLRWSASKTQTWSSILPSSGVVPPGERVGVRWIVNDGAKHLPAGEVHDFLTITDLDTAETQTRPMFLNTYDLPQITEQPTDILVAEGSGSVPAFTVKAKGSYKLAYQWQREGQTTTLSTGTGLTRWGTFGYEGYYTVRVSNPAGEVISEPVQFAVVSKAAEVVPHLAGRALEVEVTAAGDDLGFEWMQNGVPLTDGDLDGRVSGSKSPKLKITKFTSEDIATGNLFSCRVTLGEHEVVTDDFEILVQDAPVIQPVTTPPVMMTSSPVTWDIAQLISQMNSDPQHRPTRYTITGLPKGMTYDPLTGTITGSPKVTGLTSVKLTITATNAAGSNKVTVTLPFRSLPSFMYGKFVGLIERNVIGNEQFGSRVELTISNIGSITGKVITASVSRSFTSGSYEASQAMTDFEAWVNIPNGDLPPLRFAFVINVTNSSLVGTLSGSAHGGPFTAQFSGQRVPWTNVKPVNLASPFVARYTASLTPTVTTEPQYPQGLATIVGTISKMGILSGSMRKQDGQNATFSTSLSAFGAMPIYVSSHKGASSMHGWAAISGQTKDIDGSLTWFKQPELPAATTRSYKNGVPVNPLQLAGGPWVKPVSPLLPLGIPDSGGNNVLLEFTRAFIDTSSLQTGGLYAVPWRMKSSPFGSIVLPSPSPGGLTLKINLTTGEFQGTFKSVDTDPFSPSIITRPASYYGVMIQRFNSGRGHFNIPSMPNVTEPDTAKTPILSGAVKLVPTP